MGDAEDREGAAATAPPHAARPRSVTISFSKVTPMTPETLVVLSLVLSAVALAALAVELTLVVITYRRTKRVEEDVQDIIDYFSAGAFAEDLVDVCAERVGNIAGAVSAGGKAAGSFLQSFNKARVEAQAAPSPQSPQDKTNKE